MIAEDKIQKKQDRIAAYVSIILVVVIIALILLLL